MKGSEATTRAGPLERPLMLAFFREPSHLRQNITKSLDVGDILASSMCDEVY